MAYLSARDGRHADADRLVRQALGQRIGLVTSNLVLAEVQRLLLFRAGPRPARAALARLTASPSVKVLFPNEATHRDAMGWLERLDDQVLSYTDASSFALMRAERLDAALSFDHHFAVAGFSLWQG